LARPASPETSRSFSPEMSADCVYKRHEGAAIGRVGHEAVRDDHLMGCVDRDLTVVALHKAIKRGQDPAVRVDEVALRPVGRPPILSAQRLALPTHARRGTGPALVLRIGRISRFRFQRGLGGADCFEPSLLVGHPVRRLVASTTGT
jgi:hypothetical protein